MCFTFRYIKSINYLKNLLNSDGYIFSIIPDMRYTFDRKRKLTTIEHLIQDYKTDVDHYDKTHIDDYINNFDHHWDISDVLEGLDNFYDSKVIHHHTFTDNTVYEMFKYCDLEIIEHYINSNGNTYDGNIITLIKK